MQLTRNEIRAIKRQINIHKGNESLAFSLLCAIGLGFTGVIPFDLLHYMVFALSIMLSIGLIASRPSADLKKMLQAAISSDATNIENAA